MSDPGMAGEPTAPVRPEPITSADRRPARIVVVDDHDLARAGLMSVLDSLPGVQVVGQASSADEALDAVLRLDPDLVLMDIRMPGTDGLEATRAITRRFPKTPVMMISFWETPRYLLEAYQAGAIGYISKGAPRAEIVAEVERVLRGEPLADSVLARRVFEQQAIGPAAVAAARVQALSPRLLEVLGLVSEGLTNGQIAERLGIRRATVKTQVEDIFRRLGVDNRTKAATIWLISGLPPLPPPGAPE